MSSWWKEDKGLPSFLWGSCPQPPAWLGPVFASGCDGTVWHWHTEVPPQASQLLAGGYAAWWELYHLQAPSDRGRAKNRDTMLKTSSMESINVYQHTNSNNCSISMTSVLKPLYNTDIQCYITMQFSHLEVTFPTTGTFPQGQGTFGGTHFIEEYRLFFLNFSHHLKKTAAANQIVFCSLCFDSSTWSSG